MKTILEALIKLREDNKLDFTNNWNTLKSLENEVDELKKKLSQYKSYISNPYQSNDKYNQLIKDIDTVSRRLRDLKNSYTERKYTYSGYGYPDDDYDYEEYINPEKQKEVAEEEKEVTKQLNDLKNELNSLKSSLDKDILPDVEEKKKALDVINSEIQNKLNSIGELEIKNKELSKNLFEEEGFREVLNYILEYDHDFSICEDVDKMSCFILKDSRTIDPLLTFGIPVKKGYDVDDYDLDDALNSDYDQVNEDYFEELFAEEVTELVEGVEEDNPGFIVQADDFYADASDTSVSSGGTPATRWEPADYWCEVDGAVKASGSIYISKKIEKPEFDINDID